MYRPVFSVLLALSAPMLCAQSPAPQAPQNGTSPAGQAAKNSPGFPRNVADMMPGLKSVIEEARSRFVAVTTATSVASGIVLKTNYVLTNFHVLDNGSKTWVDGNEAVIVAVSPEDDLALLGVKTCEKRQILLSEGAEPLDFAFYVGNPHGIPNLAFFGLVLKVDTDAILTDLAAHDGMSGAGLYDNEGRLIGLQACGLGSKTYISSAVPASKIRKFLERVGFVKAALEEFIR
jgi:S1-C subfamily serine protease